MKLYVSISPELFESFKIEGEIIFTYPMLGELSPNKEYELSSLPIHKVLCIVDSDSLSGEWENRRPGSRYLVNRIPYSSVIGVEEWNGRIQIS